MEKGYNPSKFWQVGGRRFAVRNWMARKEKDDRLLAVPLTNEQNALYEESKGLGDSDTEIIERFFPKAPPSPTVESTSWVEVPVSMSSRTQLVMLVRQELGISAPSLERMSLADLCELVTAIRGRSKDRD